MRKLACIPEQAEDQAQSRQEAIAEGALIREYGQNGRFINQFPCSGLNLPYFALEIHIYWREYALSRDVKD